MEFCVSGQEQGEPLVKRPQGLCLVRACGTPSGADQECVRVRDLGREFESADPLHQSARVAEAFCRRRRKLGQVRDQVEMMQGPFQDVGVEVVSRGEDLPLGGDRLLAVGERGGASRCGPDVVQMKGQQTGVPVGRGEPHDQRVEWIPPGRGRIEKLPVGHLIMRRCLVARGCQRDQHILGIDDQMAHQVAYEPAGAAGGLCKRLNRQVRNRRTQRGPAVGEQVHRRKLALRSSSGTELPGRRIRPLLSEVYEFGRHGVKTQRHDVGLEDTLRAIERGVLEDVWMSRPRRWSVLLASLLLGVAAVSRWSNLGAHASPSLHVDAVVPGTSIMFLAACMFSLIALRRRRFRWCCGAAYTAALSTVTSLAALWWHQTAVGSDPLVWTLLAALASVTLTVTWLATILTPLEDSQPDMRADRF